MSDEQISPITREDLLLCSPDAAFATYVNCIGDWWDSRYTADAESLRA